jgi:hypothetical protein
MFPDGLSVSEEEMTVCFQNLERLRPYDLYQASNLSSSFAVMCNLYGITKRPQAIRDFARAMRDATGNLPPIPGVFPDYSAPNVRNATDGVRELTMARWPTAVA